jgi:hypothetical protein
MADLLARIGAAPLEAPLSVSGAEAGAVDGVVVGGASDWTWDAPVDAAEEMRALLEMWPAPAETVEGLDDLDLGSYLDSAALGLDLGVAPQSVGAY